MSLPVKLSSPATREFWEIPVLFEDEHLLALDKPAGLLTAPDPDHAERPSLMQLLHAGITTGKPWARARNLAFLDHAHRLDCETTGVLLLAKNKPALAALGDLFGGVTAVRNHLALVWGNPPAKNFSVDAKLAPHPFKPGQMGVEPKTGKKAHTDFAVLETYADWCLLRCSPQTERPHQIRVHLKHAGLPVVGDELYGGKKLWLSRLKRDYRLKPGREERPLLSRAALHAAEVELPHPVTKEILKITAPWPKDLKVAVKYLRQFSAG